MALHRKNHYFCEILLNMNALSVVIITHNEEKNIGRCVQSLQGVADEIIVVDSFSNDATESICNSFDVKFVKHKWEGYVRQKQYANSLASNDLVFSIDADEAVSPELKKSILKIKELSSDKKVFSMNRLMNYCGKWIRHGGWFPDVKIRIFDRRFVSWTGGQVHETLDVPDDFAVVHLDGNLLHYSFYSEAEFRRQTEKFARLSADDAIMKGKKGTMLGACFHSFWRFVRDFVFKAGFLDGKTGFRISLINAKSVFLKRKLIVNTSDNNGIRHS